MEVNEDIEAFISKVALGDREAFSALYDATSAKLFAVCIRVLKQRDVAEDVLQEVFIKVWKNAERYQVTGHSPMTWLITIARNTAIDRIRARKDHDDLDDFSNRIAATEPTPEQAAIASSEWKRVTICLDALKEDRKQAIKGAYLHGKSYQELSEEFKVPLNTMRTWLRRGLGTLRECLSQ